MELNLHWSLMEKLSKLEREEGETIGEAVAPQVFNYRH
jgi:hypothetical protein